MPTSGQDILIPKNTHTWRWPAVVNLTLGGMAAGFFLFGAAALGLVPTGRAGALQPMLAVAPALTVLGMATVSLEIGRVRHAGRIFSNLASSWMAREALLAVVFIIFATAAAFIDPSAWILVLAVTAAAGFVVCQGMMVRRCLAVAAWRLPAVGLFFLTSAAASGFALFFLICLIAGVTAPAGITAAGLAAVALNAALWLRVLRSARLADAPAVGTAASLTLMLGFGHLVPAILLGAGLLRPLSPKAPALLDPALALACLCIVAATGWQKYALIVKMAVPDKVAAPMALEALTHRLACDSGDGGLGNRTEPN